MKIFIMIWCHCAPDATRRYIHITGGRNIKDTPYFALYGEIYRLHGKYLEPVADDSFWSALMQDVDTLYKKYKDTPLKAFAEHLALEVCREIEASYKRRIDI